MMTICKRSVWKCILLSFLTFGFYTVYWLYLQARNVRALKHNAKSLRREMIFLLFIPFYWIYWMYESGKTIRVKLSGKSERIGSNEFLFLVLSLICPVRMTWIICLAVMQHDMNGVPAESDKPGNQYFFARDNAFSVEAICLHIEKDVASMGYDVKVSYCGDDGFRMTAEKDLTPIDFVLGRQQKILFRSLVFDRSETETVVELTGTETAWLDKIFCFLTGPFVFLINWIFMFLCFGNQNNTVQVAKRSLQNYADKLKNEREKTD